MSSDTQHVTIAQIASAAGVSTPTVSRVLNGRSDVAPGTRDRVERLLREQGYRRRGRAVLPRAGLLDLVFHDLDSPWALEIIRGVQDEARALGLGTVVSAVHPDEADRGRWLDNVRRRASDGAVMVTTTLDARLDAELAELDVPVVVVDPAGLPDLDVPTVGATNWAGGWSATEHVASLGHRVIGYVAGPQQMLCARARLAGHRAALDAAGLPPDSPVEVGEFDYASGSRAADVLLERSERPTAVVAASDHLALGVVEAARRRGLRVPQDLSVVGFDDLPGSRWASPPLTTVRQPMAEMGRLAVRTIGRRLDGEAVDVMRVELATRLVVRQSTAAPA